ncbi:hypothetical protein [Oceanobacillus sojae]|nr:hypothetical protein [Oceanobacillus sojae]MCT1903794.1 hypothetical protein [Oceanobacillus sojae]
MTYLYLFQTLISRKKHPAHGFAAQMLLISLKNIKEKAGLLLLFTLLTT